MLPSTLNEWMVWKPLTERGNPRDLWDSLEPFFASQGLALFQRDLSGGGTRAQDHPTLRAADPYHQWLPSHILEPMPSRFNTRRTIHVAARTTEGTDVIIRLVVKGHEGRHHLGILQKLASAELRDDPSNHALPLLRTIIKEDMVFAVFPLVAPYPFGTPWFQSVAEVLQAVEQVFEGFAFLHKHLIAHRDFATPEVLHNYGGTVTPWANNSDAPYRQHFDVHYYLNDFELSVMFDPTSEASSRLVQGIPVACYGRSSNQYGKPLPPEALEDAPYCPFKADVFQVGWPLMEILRHLNDVPEVAPIYWIFTWMTSPLPEERPSFADSLSELRRLKSLLTQKNLDQPLRRAWQAAEPPHLRALKASVPTQPEASE